MADEAVELRMRVAREFADWLREKFGDVILDVRVFGSTARGHVHEESDVDVFFLISRPLELEEELEVAGKSFDLLMETDVFLQWVDLTEERWERPLTQATGLAQSVKEEGIAV